MQYSTTIGTVPSNLVAGIFGFHGESLFAVDEADRAPVQVRF